MSIKIRKVEGLKATNLCTLLFGATFCYTGTDS
jgi:hypothetical protein